MLSRAINNPGDICNYFGEQKSKTVFVGNTYHNKVVEHFKSKCIIPIEEISVKMGEYVDEIICSNKQEHQVSIKMGQYIDDFIFIDKKGDQHVSGKPLLIER